MRSGLAGKIGLLTSVLAAFFLISCGSQPQQAKEEKASSFKLDYKTYKLENGLEVILHEDKSDPIVSVAIQFHVGSNREEVGKTGFAHLFEHMLFQESQHVPKDTFFKNINSVGGTLNGGTGNDSTTYYEVVPKNALEMVLWMESDRMGWLLSTVSEEALLNQQDVVQNEKRQRVDNRPYGHTNYVIDKTLYPEGHPYNWQIIGSFEDLKNAKIEDLHNFFHKWYGPNNATLVIAGDFDETETRALIEKYFGEIKPSEPVANPKPMPVTLSETRKVFHEDNFAGSPELNMVFPTVEAFNSEQYSLDLMARLLGGSKQSPLYDIIVKQRELAPEIAAYNSSQEIAGTFQIRVRTFKGTDLDLVENAIQDAFTAFEQNGFSEADLQRAKATLETDFYNQIDSVLGKSWTMAYFSQYAGSIDQMTRDLELYRAVTPADINNAFNKYVKGKNYVLTSFVPKGEPELAVENSTRAEVVEENISSAGVATDAEAAPKAVAEKLPLIPSILDRSVKPTPGPNPETTIPAIWHAKLDNGTKMHGIVHNELPLIEFEIRIEGGMLMDQPGKRGTANLVASLFKEGTASKTPIELENAISQLGARVDVSSDDSSLSLTVNTLASNLDQVVALVDEMLLEPRWDEADFMRVRKEVVENIKRTNTRPAIVATQVFSKLVLGADHPLAQPSDGTVESVEAVSLEDLKAWRAANLSPKAATILIVGDISQDQAVKTFANLSTRWNGGEVSLPNIPAPVKLDKSALYFVDMPGAKQSEIRVGYAAMPYSDADYYPAVVMNHQLGGHFSGVLNMVLREEKGYTYGARSGFNADRLIGMFVAGSAVRSNATMDSVKIFHDEIAHYRDGISEEDLSATKDSLVKGNVRNFETLGALRDMLRNIAALDLSDDYVKVHEQIVKDMTLDRHRELANKYLPPDMVYLVVGDAETQMKPLKDLGMGSPTLLDSNGVLVDAASRPGM